MERNSTFLNRDRSENMHKYKHMPSPDENIRAAYRQLVHDIDIMADTLTRERFSTVMQCRAGCSDCCVQFSVLPLEAALVAEMLGGRALSAKQENEKCLLLSDDLCLVYEVRPIICRTQGLPLGYIDEEAGAIEVSACPINFPDDFPLSHDDLMFMDAFNQRLAELNLQYCRLAGLDPEVRIPLADLVQCG
jgi:Fe-S-cluster containining protein